LLAQKVVAETGGKARFVSENYGDSALAKRFGVKRYPAIFVDDVLVATPKDFGFYGKGEGADNGRYAPFVKNAASQQRFRADLKRMVDLILSGRKDAARAEATTAKEEGIASLPDFTVTDIRGTTLSRKDLAGRVVVVEMWATWCPPCRGTLGWLAGFAKLHADELAVVTIAIESDEAGVRNVADATVAPLHWVMGTPELVRAFGDVGGLPTLLVFDREGKAAGTFFGAPPGTHEAVEAALTPLFKTSS
jgi:thiol-disulfide isomerase/thioredoxin